MADQETIPIGLETQNKVAKAIYLRWHRNGIIDHDPNTCSNSMSAGIRSLAVYGKE